MGSGTTAVPVARSESHEDGEFHTAGIGGRPAGDQKRGPGTHAPRVRPERGHTQRMTPHVPFAVELAERWQGPPWFRWAFLGVWALCGVYVLVRLRRNGWKFPRRR
ncbi:hypothetical protein [Streptomyces sp. NPDC102282]|uniref:hypothetical protein n=1 Tax=Streptomyces sp. NPDC102282 TaxID=3366154 RepID=UPI0038187136